ncbi:hypothetical protein Tco_1491978 [Tanacetum coccineum]
MITSKLPGSMGIKSILNRCFRKFSVQSYMMVSIPMTFLSANSTEYLVSTVDGMMPLKELNSAEVRLLSTRFHALAIITSFALTLGPSEVLSVRESHNLRDSNSPLGTTVMTVGVSVVIGGVGIGVVVWSSTGGMVETDGGGRSVVVRATEGVSGIGVRTEGSEITETCTIRTGGD